MTSNTDNETCCDSHPDGFPPSPKRKEGGEPPTRRGGTNDGHGLASIPPPSIPPPPSVAATLALIPLRPPPCDGNRRLEAKQLPVVLGRTNLAQWWYQSCDCQHYYCRLHCRPVAQNIGSLSKVMIQIDSNGTVHVVGKNPHLVTITPERKEQRLQVNDVLSIGRRDREPWMRFQVVSRSDARHAVGGREEVMMDEPVRKRQKTSQCSAAGDDTMGIGGSDGGGRNKSHEGRENPNDNNQGSSLASENDLPSAPAMAPIPALPDDQPSHSQHQERPPEWITTTRAEKGKSSRDTTSRTHNGRDTDTAQQQHNRALVARLAHEAAAANDEEIAARDKQETNLRRGGESHRANGSASNAHRRRRRGRSTRRGGNSLSAHSANKYYSGHARNVGGVAGTFSTRAIRSAEDLFIGSLPHRDPQYPQIHLISQGYETSAQLVRATHRGNYGPLTDTSSFHQQQAPGKQHSREPRTDKNFIGKLLSQQRPVDSPVPSSKGYGGIVCGTVGGRQATQLGLLSRNFEAALLGLSPANHSNVHGDGNGDDDDVKHSYDKNSDTILPAYSSTQMQAGKGQKEAPSNEEVMPATDKVSTSRRIPSTGIHHYESDGWPEGNPKANELEQPLIDPEIEEKEPNPPELTLAAADGASLPALLDDDSPVEPTQDYA